MDSVHDYSADSFDTLETASVSSLDIEDILARHGEGPSLLRETLELPPVRESPLEKVPPLPAGRRPPIAAVVGLGTCLPLFPAGLNRGDELCDDRTASAPLLALPTSQRLHVMLREELYVEQWVNNIVVSDAPGHVPWAGPDNPEPVPWVPEGSLFSPDDFQEKLSRLRRSSRHEVTNNADDLASYKGYPEQMSISKRSIKGRSCVLPSTPSFREAHVFERQVRLGPENERKHWSLQVPAAEMTPEIVDMVLELQNLTSYFREDDASEDPVRSADLVSDNKPVPPLLIVSNSTSAIPISLSSSTNLEAETLAARRGRKAPTPLNIIAGNDSYPTIPTAFLSPSEYHPKSDASYTIDSSIGLASMVSKLRSQCASLCNFQNSSRTEIEQDLTIDIHASTASDEDEWAFAKDLLACHDNSSELSVSGSLESLESRQSVIPRSRESTPTGVRPENHKSRSSMQRRASTSEAPPGPHATTPNPPPHPPPPLPLPSPPARAAPRGILKNSKNVRFASLPSRHSKPPMIAETPPARARPRHSTGPATTRITRPQLPPLPTAMAPPRPASTSPAQGSPRSIMTRSAVMNSIASTRVSTGTMKAVQFAALPSQNERDRARSITLSRGHQSVGPVAVGSTATKENRARASSSPGTPLRQSSVVDENATKHASLRVSLTQKSRMPVPLRNIFTRFKQTP